MPDHAEKKLLAAITEARAGVDYSAQSGATCPYCRTPRAKVTGSLPWESGTKTRYHKCARGACPLHKGGITFKSVQVEPVPNQAVC